MEPILFIYNILMLSFVSATFDFLSIQFIYVFGDFWLNMCDLWYHLLANFVVVVGGGEDIQIKCKDISSMWHLTNSMLLNKNNS